MIKHVGEIGNKIKKLLTDNKKELTQQDLIDLVYNYCKRYFNHYKKFPTIEKIMSSTNLKRNKVIEILRFLILQGKVKRNYSYYHFPGKLKKDIIKKQNKKISGRKIDKIWIDDIPKKENKNAFNINKIKLFILKIIIFFVGVIATLMSIYYTKIWFDTMMDNYKALAMSLCMVGFSISAFEIIILLKNNKQRVTAIVFTLLWIIVLLFSMTSTIAGQYNQFREKQIEYMIKNTDNTYLIYQELLKEEEEVEKEIKGKVEERDRYLRILSEFNTSELAEENEKKINSYRNSVYYLNRDITKLRKELKTIRDKKSKMLEEDKIVENIKKEDFFQWVGNILKIKSFIIQFWLSLFPAIFIDIIAPLSFAVILFYKIKEEE